MNPWSRRIWHQPRGRSPDRGTGSKSDNTRANLARTGITGLPASCPRFRPPASINILLANCVLCDHIMRMNVNTLTLSLSNSAYRKALELARNHGVPVVAYLSTELEDLLDIKAQVSQNREPALANEPPSKSSPQPNFSSVLPDTLSQIFEVCKYVYRHSTVPEDEVHSRAEYKEAVRTVAQNVGVRQTTVRDKCGTNRRLGLPDVSVNTDVFVAWLSRPEQLRDHLCRKFPKFVTDIHHRFADWLPDRFRTKSTV